MPHYTEYLCTNCGQYTERELLTVKKVVFTEMGSGGKVLKSRTIGWLCNDCIEDDEHYNLDAYTTAPGLKSPGLERVRAAERKEGLL